MIPQTDPLALDTSATAARLQSFIVDGVRRLNRRGVVLGVSGGIDSAVCAALAAKALGPQRVFALLMPEKDCSAEGTSRALTLCSRLGIPHQIVDITQVLAAFGYERERDAAIRAIFPDWGKGWRHKIVTTARPLERDGITQFDLVVQDCDGTTQIRRLPLDAYLHLVAATNFKQRIRKTIEYFHADRLNHAVVGTPNRLEYELGFFVRGGDGLADIKPIASLYKTQVYALAEHLGVPEEIRSQPPSTDTYTLPQTQEEFYFAVPYALADRVLHALECGSSAEATAAALELEPEQVRRLFKDFTAKRRVAARFLGEALRPE
jgi:NAD+ synthase